MTEAFDPLLRRSPRVIRPAATDPDRRARRAGSTPRDRYRDTAEVEGAGPWVVEPPRRARRLLWPVLVLVVTVGVLIVTLLPVRSYFRQRQTIGAAETAVAQLHADNKALEDQVAALDTPDAIEKQARQQLHMVKPGEEAFAVLPPQFPTDLPDLFPYPLARQLLEQHR